jgi:hypothetical protein
MTDSKSTKAILQKIDSPVIFPVSFAIAAFVLTAIGILNYLTVDAGQYWILAKSFLAARLDLIEEPTSGWRDSAPFDDKHFWPLGPLPALIALPFVLVNWYHQGTISFFLTVTIFYLCFRLARRFQYLADDACWLACAFCFGTSFIGVAAIAYSWYFAHVVAVLFLFFAIMEFEGTRRYWLIGCFVGLAMASRPTAGLNIFFFVVAAALGIGATANRTLSAFALIIGFAVIFILLSWYNFARFGNPFESGYTYQISFGGQAYAIWDRAGNIPGVLFSLANVPTNFAFFLFALPSARALGTSFFLMSPFLLYLASIRYWDTTNKLLALNITLVLIAVLAFRNVGFYQVGYRFSLDFLPFVFWLMMRARLKITKGFKSLVLAATIFDFCLVIHFLVSTGDR